MSVGADASRRPSASSVAAGLSAGFSRWSFLRKFVLDLPGGVAIVPLLVLLFVAIAAIIAAIAGTHFTVPRSGNIPGLHTNYWIPPIAAATGYLLLQCVAKFVGPNQRSWGEIAKHAAQDYFLLALFILVIYVHFNIKMWVPVINPNLYDQDYYAIDQALSPVIAFLGFLRAAVARVLPAADIWYQAAFFAIFVLSFLSHALGRRGLHYHNMVALLLIEMVGPLSYLIAPAVGPFIYEHGASALATTAELKMYDVYQHVRAGGAGWISQNGGAFFAEPLAAMPSLHVGATLVIVYYAIKARLWVAPVTVAAFLWICIESVVARWHYLVDLPAGILLAIGVIAFTNWLCRPAQSNQRSGNEPDPNRIATVSPGGNSGAVVPLPTRKKTRAALRTASGRATRLRSPQAYALNVWVMKCHRAGDHAQSLALAQALGHPFVVKEMKFRWYELFFALAGCATLAGIDRRRSSPLVVPWPDLIILAGRQNETPAKWIRKQSGGHTRIVVIGRNWTPADELDCVITTPQFRLPEHPNVLQNDFPLHLATKERLAEAAVDWAPRLAALPKPYVAVMVGGSSGPYRFNARSAGRLGREASALARAMGASLLVSTSARTGRAALRALQRSIDVPCHIHRFRPNDGANPYMGFLGIADAVIVTGDSMSMIAEACETGRPVYIFEFGGGPAAMRGPRSNDPGNRQWWRWSQLREQGLLGLHYAFAIGLPAWRLNRSRDIRLVQDRFIASGRARWLGDSATVSTQPAPGRAPRQEDLQRAVRRVYAMLRLNPDLPATLDAQKADPSPAVTRQPA
jgi:mitochondrial fission protein ELM1